MTIQKLCFLVLAAALCCAGCIRADDTPAGNDIGVAAEATGFLRIDRAEREVLEAVVQYGDAPVKIENCDFTDDGVADDILYIIPTKLVPGQYGDDYVELRAVLGDGSEASVILDEKFSADEPNINIHYRMDVYVADLDGGGDRIIVGNTTMTNTWATDVYVFRIVNNEFHRLLTVLDTISSRSPEEIKKYEDSLFIISELVDNFGMPEEYRQFDAGYGPSVCSGVFVPNEYADNNRRDILILHSLKYNAVPYTVLSWDGEQWAVVKQTWVADVYNDGFYLDSGGYDLNYDY
ncbi:MAG: hypothetical protein LBK23_06795 [Oscillospiraceae bacterium]|nr:hypothetical protein [Oscillospiraceae bacterium]